MITTFCVFFFVFFFLNSRHFRPEPAGAEHNSSGEAHGLAYEGKSEILTLLKSMTKLGLKQW